MISYIKGELVSIDIDCIVVDNNGIGYNIFIPASIISSLPLIGQEVKIHTYFLVKEDAMHLYGFLSTEDLRLFKMLISVNGIGPKGALSILSVMSVSELKTAIISDNAKAISKAPGIGSKTAQRVIIDLKDKLKNEDLMPETVDYVNASGNGDGNNISEAVMALMSLGYSQTEARKAVKDVDKDAAVEDILKAALKNLL